ncbi:MAG TPA: STAS domain-containing protein [Acidimicrobiales bacterium]|nr:STAS domain-containing protein [Acidimicrobiales bacterium]
MELSFTTRPLGDSTVLEVAGEIDITTAPRFRARLIEAIGNGHRSLVIDLTAVQFIDSTGLGVLIGARRRLGDSGGALSVVAPPGPIRELFTATDLDGIFTIFDSLPVRTGH